MTPVKVILRALTTQLSLEHFKNDVIDGDILFSANDDLDKLLE